MFIVCTKQKIFEQLNNDINQWHKSIRVQITNNKVQIIRSKNIYVIPFCSR